MIKIGPAGLGSLPIEGLGRIAEAGLTAAECEFTYGVRMTNAAAKEIGAAAKKLGIELSVHCPYYINLATDDAAKLDASKKRILDSCERGHWLGAGHIVFHAGFYCKLTKEQCYERVRQAVEELQSAIKANKWNVILAPETTGKHSVFGDLDELLRLRNETGCGICIDFAHLKARAQGKINYPEIFEKITSLKHVHSHFSGIEWTKKGERRHLITPEKEITVLFEWINRYKKDVTIINESPDPFGDAVKMLGLSKARNLSCSLFSPVKNALHF